MKQLTWFKDSTENVALAMAKWVSDKVVFLWWPNRNWFSARTYIPKASHGMSLTWPCSRIDSNSNSNLLKQQRAKSHLQVAKTLIKHVTYAYYI